METPQTQSRYWDRSLERVRARMEGSVAAIAGRKLDANHYDENDDLHFEWLAGWTDALLARMK